MRLDRINLRIGMLIPRRTRGICCDISLKFIARTLTCLKALSRTSS
jgi:hypothetical protein